LRLKHPFATAHAAAASPSSRDSLTIYVWQPPWIAAALNPLNCSQFGKNIYIDGLMI
jgi:hypothetical protein